MVKPLQGRHIPARAIRSNVKAAITISSFALMMSLLRGPRAPGRGRRPGSGGAGAPIDYNVARCPINPPEQDVDPAGTQRDLEILETFIGVFCRRKHRPAAGALCDDWRPVHGPLPRLGRGVAQGLRPWGGGPRVPPFPSPPR